MAVCNPQNLLGEAGCLSCLGEKELLSIIAKLLCDISGMSCNPQTLLNDASCLGCLGEKELLTIIAQLLCNIYTGGGMGGGGATCGDVNPVAAPTGTCAIYINRSNSTLWYWDNTAGAWILFG